MGTIEYYYKNVPEKYLVKTDKHIIQITDYLNKNFGEAWGGFDTDYVDRTKDDRLIYQDDDGNVIFHMRVFNKDHSGFKCSGIGGMFKREDSNSDHVKELLSFITNSNNTDSHFSFGFCRKHLAEHFINNIILKGSFIDYDVNFVIYYVSQEDFMMTSEILEGLKKFDLF